MDEEKQENTSEEKIENDIETKEDGKVAVPEMSIDEVKKQLPFLEGLIFKVDKMFFKVTYINVGKRRFTAELINDLKE